MAKHAMLKKEVRKFVSAQKKPLLHFTVEDINGTMVMQLHGLSQSNSRSIRPNRQSE